MAVYSAEAGLLSANTLPIKGLGFINSTPVGPLGGDFPYPEKIPRRSIYLNAIRNSERSVENAKSLLGFFGVSLNTVELRFK